jgi:hypothetical protein
VISFPYFLMSCDMELSESSSTDISDFNEIYENQTKSPAVLGKGYNWKEMDNLFKDCFESPTSRKMAFGGFSNSLRLGDTRTKKGDASYSLTDIISEEEFAKLVLPTANTFDNCNKNKKLQRMFSAGIKSQLTNFGNLDLNHATKRNDSITIETSNIVLKELNVDALADLLNSDDQRFNTFNKALLKNGHFIISQVLFGSLNKFKIYLDRDISDSLNIKLSQNFIDQIKIGQTSGQVQIHAINKHILECTINENFVLFFKPIKGKKIL